MKRIAQNILIENEVKTDFILDSRGEPTEQTYEYKEYKIVDGEGNVLEIGRYTQESITVEEILERTGIKFGLSTWITI
jgi:hypothetical protein